MGRPKSLEKSLPIIWRVIRYFSPYLRNQRDLLLGSIFALIAEVGFRLLEPWPIKYVFDYIIAPDNKAKNYDFIRSYVQDPVLLLTICAIALVSFTGLRAMASYFNTVGFALVGNRVTTQIRDKLYRHLQYLSLAFHTKARAGDLAFRLIGDVGTLRDVAVTALIPLLASVMIILGMVLVMFWMSWSLTLLALIIAPLFWLRTITLNRRIHQVARKQRERQGAMAATAAESISAIKVIHALSLHETFAKIFSSQNKRELKQSVKATRLAASLERSVDVLVAVGTAIALWYGARLVLRNELSAGDIIVFLTYLRSAFKPVRDFAKYTTRLAKAAASGERVLDILEQTPDIRDLPGAVVAHAFRGEVQFEGVSFAYEPEMYVLNGIDFRIHPGCLVAIVGPSGIGKSTLVSLILRLYDPTEGRITIDGHDIREYTVESLRSQISVVLQDNILFAASVRDNIAYGTAAPEDNDIVSSAVLANADEFIKRLPKGYDTVLGERGETLSHGQRQRIAIARAAIRKSPLLVLDEPTTALDEENERAVIEAIERVRQGCTTFIVTHDLHYAASADLIIYLQDGRISEIGTPVELIQAKGRYAMLYKLQRSKEHKQFKEEQHYALATRR